MLLRVFWCMAPLTKRLKTLLCEFFRVKGWFFTSLDKRSLLVSSRKRFLTSLLRGIRRLLSQWLSSLKVKCFFREWWIEAMKSFAIQTFIHQKLPISSFILSQLLIPLWRISTDLQSRAPLITSTREINWYSYLLVEFANFTQATLNYCEMPSAKKHFLYETNQIKSLTTTRCLLL